VRDPEAHRASLSYRAGYLTHDSDGRDAIDWNPEWSRRARAFPTWAALRQLGRQGVARLVEGCCDAARDIVRGIGEIEGAEVVAAPVLNQGLVRFGAGDAATDAVIAAVQSEGEAFFGGTTWHGRRAMRVSVCNWQTGPEEVKRSVAAVARAWGRRSAAAGRL